ncbi:MAG: 30S ribosomal protein S9 [Verrucomicrobia bacterium]|nr:30S ribosomal protein S9 [Verrucomicrobiota bacterium]MBS0637019.1 30S ribosomal protein S9 [Verrucomicrobiota bacterium]
MQENVATGRRKTSVASVRLRDGKGEVLVNKRKFDDYFPLELQRRAIMAPFECLNLKSSYDILVRVRGGGVEAQAEAIRLGISRCLVLEDEKRKHALKEQGFLTRDSRKKERKKYGRAGARKRFQFSKR